MPANPEWFPRLPAIIAAFETLDTHYVDRVAIEKIFLVKSRRAFQLLHRFGGVKKSRGFLATRQTVLTHLQAMRDDYEAEEQRKARVRNELEEARRLAPGRRIRIGTAPDVDARVVADLPAGIHLQPGLLRIEFHGTEDLVRHLYELSCALANDYARFEALAEEPQTNGRRTSQAEIAMGGAG